MGCVPVSNLLKNLDRDESDRCANYRSRIEHDFDFALSFPHELGHYVGFRLFIPGSEPEIFPMSCYDKAQKSGKSTPRRRKLTVAFGPLFGVCFWGSSSWFFWSAFSDLFRLNVHGGGLFAAVELFAVLFLVAYGLLLNEIGNLIFGPDGKSLRNATGKYESGRYTGLAFVCEGKTEEDQYEIVRHMLLYHRDCPSSPPSSCRFYREFKSSLS